MANWENSLKQLKKGKKAEKQETWTSQKTKSTFIINGNLFFLVPHFVQFDKIQFLKLLV